MTSDTGGVCHESDDARTVRRGLFLRPPRNRAAGTPAGEVLIRVAGSSFNPIDHKIATLGDKLGFAPDLPAVPAWTWPSGRGHPPFHVALPARRPGLRQRRRAQIEQILRRGLASAQTGLGKGVGIAAVVVEPDAARTLQNLLALGAVCGQRRRIGFLAWRCRGDDGQGERGMDRAKAHEGSSLEHHGCSASRDFEALVAYHHRPQRTTRTAQGIGRSGSACKRATWGRSPRRARRARRRCPHGRLPGAARSAAPRRSSRCARPGSSRAGSPSGSRRRRPVPRWGFPLPPQRAPARCRGRRGESPYRRRRRPGPWSPWPRRSAASPRASRDARRRHWRSRRSGRPRSGCVPRLRPPSLRPAGSGRTASGPVRPPPST